MIRVLVVDDHPVVRSGLVGVLAGQDGVEVIAEAGDGDEAVRIATDLRPDVILMDLRMPNLDGVAATSRILEGWPEARIMILSTFNTDADVLRAIEAGAVGYLLKDAPTEQIVNALRATARGERSLAPLVESRLEERARHVGPADLSPREIEILILVGRGLSNAEIGRELFIGEATVKTHLLHAFGKLGVDDRTRAVTLAMRLGIIPTD